MSGARTKKIINKEKIAPTKTSLQINGDDSSDEEDNNDIATTKLSLTTKEAGKLPRYIQKVDPQNFSSSAFIIGVNQLYSSKVSEEYYQKKALLPESGLQNADEILPQVTDILSTLIDDAFTQITDQSSLSSQLLQAFQKENKDWIKSQIAKICSDERALLKQLNTEEANDVIQKVISALASKAIQFIKGYNENLILTAAPSFKYGDFQESVYAYIEKFFRDKKLINSETLKFIARPERPKIKKIKDEINNKLMTYFNQTSAIQKVSTYFDRNNEKGKKRLNTIIKMMFEFESKAEEDSCIKAVKGGGFRFQSQTDSIPDDNTFLGALFDDDKILEQKYLPYTDKRFKKEMLEHVSEILTAESFVLRLQVFKARFQVVRGTHGHFTFKSDNFIEFYANIRLSMRIQTRRMRNNSDQNIEKTSTYNSEWGFGDVDYLVTESQDISKNGSRSDIVKNLSSYGAIHKEIMEFNPAQRQGLAECIIESDVFSQAKLTARFTSLKIAQNKIYVYRNLLLNLTYLILGCEVQRNPAALVSNMLMLQLISKGSMSWQAAINSTGEMATLGGGGSMPMSMGSYTVKKKKIKSNVVKCARTLHEHYGLFAARPWLYQGDTSNEKEHIGELVKREYALTKMWAKKKDFSELSQKEIAEKVNNVVTAIIKK